ncbi:unnamed protein product [Microthlaspi erraticum]|uniref:Uncharacterized protein n=1 Tax=Microthlaspi erraticum TaxID=1685480 RepID=A0A6D2IG01_9BRAS|nr:unnamed protein product [Microthlaspi erraticum]
MYSSYADPVHVPSPDSRASAVGTIRREVRGVGSGGKPSENVAKDPPAAGSLAEREVRGVGSGGKPSENVAKDPPAAGSLAESAITKDVPKAYRPFSPISKIDQAGGHPRGVPQNKQWKPKSNQKSNNPGVIGTPKKSRAPATDNSVNLESEIEKPQDTVLHVSISESQNVIIADDIRVPKTDRYQLSFGSFVMDFDPSVNTESGFEEACSSQELKRVDIVDSLPTPPMQGYTGNPAAQYAHPSNGNSYVLMPGGSSHPGANGLNGCNHLVNTYFALFHGSMPASKLKPFLCSFRQNNHNPLQPIHLSHKNIGKCQ